jgi:hypothetical protein
MNGEEVKEYDDDEEVKFSGYEMMTIAFFYLYFDKRKKKSI